MPRNATRRCIEWAPGDAALEALQIAERLYPELPRQETIDRLVLTGLHALRYPPYAPPPLFGRDRDRWRLPAGVQIDAAELGKRPTLGGERPVNSRDECRSPFDSENLSGKDN